jgi:signal transduction histidine kinase
VQEALANVRKHAQARQARSEFQRVGSQLRVLIGDDGKGFDPAAQAANGRRTSGLASMRERAEALGGLFDLESGLGTGTRIKVEVPLEGEVDGRARPTLAPVTG